MGYLVCDKCGGYYELQPGEHPEDFDWCECGGKLSYKLRIMGYDDNQSMESSFDLSSLTKNLKIVGVGFAVIAVILLKFLPLFFKVILNILPDQLFFQYGILILVLLGILFIASRLLGLGRRFL